MPSRYSFALRLLCFAILVWVFIPLPRQQADIPWQPLTQEQENYWHVFGVPDLTVALWEEACGGPAMPVAELALPFYVNSVLPHCTIQVAVECPPDCDLYKVLREDTSLRRID